MELTAILANVDEVDKMVTALENAQLAEKVRTSHLATLRANGAKAARRAVPRRGDIVAILDESGQIARTGTVATKPSNITLIWWNGQTVKMPVNTDKLHKIAQGIWVVR